MVRLKGIMDALPAEKKLCFNSTMVRLKAHKQTFIPS